MNPIRWFLHKFFSKYEKYEKAVALLSDMLFFFVFIWFGIHWQPEFIYVCNQTTLAAWNSTINMTVTNMTLFP